MSGAVFNPQLAQQRYSALLKLLQQAGKQGLAICFSGGVDSTLLLAAAQQAAISPLLAVHFITPTMARYDTDCARTYAQQLEAPLQLIEVDTLALPQVASNSRQRCYHCKKALYQAARQAAAQAGCAAIADGCNSDDLLAYRPGNQAAAEAGILHPLAEAQLSKADIRYLARMLQLPNHDRPSAPCLVSRFPYDTPLGKDVLAQVERAEQLLRQLGLNEFRLRVHNELARLELADSELPQALRYKEQINEELRRLGYRYITLDLQPLSSGSFDR